MLFHNGENRQITYTNGPSGAVTNYEYDGDGRRVKRSDLSTGTTVFVYNAGGQLITEYVTGNPSGGGGTSYLTTDHLGSTRVVTGTPDSGGVVPVKARHDYLPFGEEIAASIGSRSGAPGYSATDPIKQRFTCKERDTESGFDYFLARYYSSASGRFCSADSVGGHGGNPQSFNRYAYTVNNPVVLVDPDGHDWIGYLGNPPGVMEGSHSATDTEQEDSDTEQDSPVDTVVTIEIPTVESPEATDAATTESGEANTQCVVTVRFRPVGVYNLGSIGIYHAYILTRENSVDAATEYYGAFPQQDGTLRSFPQQYTARVGEDYQTKYIRGVSVWVPGSCGWINKHFTATSQILNSSEIRYDALALNSNSFAYTVLARVGLAAHFEDREILSVVGNNQPHPVTYHVPGWGVVIPLGLKK